MRYYRYGSDQGKKELETKEGRRADLVERYGELIIDEDTVYEIDEECLRCRDKEGK